jgi:signal transduction histidine kinase
MIPKTLAAVFENLDIVITVEDTGRGMKAEQQARMFTKPVDIEELK